MGRGAAGGVRLSGEAYADPAVPFLEPDASRQQVPKAPKRLTLARLLGLRRGSTRGSIYNLFSSVLGAGVLGLPHAVAAWGLLPGLLMVVPFALVSFYTLRLLGWLGELTGAKSYRHLAELTLGRRFPVASRLVSVAIFLNTFGSLVVYLIVLGDLIPSFARLALGAAGLDPSAPPAALAPLLSGSAVIAGSGLLFGLPLSLVRDLSMLRYTSFLSMGSILFLAALLCVRFCQGLATGNEGRAAAARALAMRPRGPLASLLGGLPTFIYAFSCHFNFFAAVEALKRRTRKAVLQVQLSAIALSLLTYVLIVAAVLLTYADRTASDFLLNLPTSGGAFTLAKVLYTTVLVAAYPLNCHPCRAALLEQLGAAGRSESTRTAATVALVGASIALAILCPNIAVALSLVGGTATSSILYIFPALFFLAATADQLGPDAQLRAAADRELADADTDAAASDDDEAESAPYSPFAGRFAGVALPSPAARHAGARCAGLIRLREHRLACRALLALGAFAWLCSALSLVAPPIDG